MSYEALTAQKCRASGRSWLQQWGKKKSSNQPLEQVSKPKKEESNKGQKQKEADETAEVPQSEEKPAPSTPKITPVASEVSNQPKETPSLVRKKAPDASPASQKSNKQKEENHPFDEKALQQSWEVFRKECEEKGASDTEMLVLNRSVSKNSEHEVMIHLASSLEVSILDRLEQGIVQHFRISLKNTSIQLIKEVTEQEKSRKLYTSKEKYDYMVEQNPALKDLKDRLGLDFEF